jgi:hypothetical protein
MCIMRFASMFLVTLGVIILASCSQEKKRAARAESASDEKCATSAENSAAD